VPDNESPELHTVSTRHSRLEPEYPLGFDLNLKLEVSSKGWKMHPPRTARIIAVSQSSNQEYK